MTTVLIADDEPIARELLRFTLLEVNSHLEVVEECGNGRQAVESALRLQPDMVLLDVKMPLMDGLQAGMIIKRHLPDVFLVYVSAYDDFSYAQKAITIGTAAYLLKPVDLAAIEELLKRMTRKQPRVVESSDDTETDQPSRQDALLHVLGYIDKHLDEALTLKTLAEEAAYHPASLSRAFKRSFGVGLSEYITSLRIERAQSLLLRYPSMSIQEVATSCGFASPQYFHSVFHDYLSCSPSDFRSRLVKKP